MTTVVIHWLMYDSIKIKFHNITFRDTELQIRLCAMEEIE